MREAAERGHRTPGHENRVNSRQQASAPKSGTVLAPALPQLPLSRRRLLVALACLIALTVAGLVAPARGLASDAPFTPSPAGQVAVPRTCPSPTVAAYYTTTCWTVMPDHGNPLYWADGPYPWAQCTYWALEMRPDLWNNRSATDPNANDWTAYTWPAHAALEGLTVDHAPAAGAIIVWPQSADNATGHVVYVQSVTVDPVTGDDLVTVQEMNDTTFDDPTQGQGDTMTMSMDAADLAQTQIIHAPGNTTGTVPTGPALGRSAGTPSGSSSTTRTTGTTPASPAPPARATRASAPPRSTRDSQRPRLSVRLGRHGVSVSSRSPAALRATIFQVPSGKLLSRARLRPGFSLRLPAGRFQMCVSQSAGAGWASARACVTAGRSPSAATRVRPQAVSRAFGEPLLALR
jgi:surface antigen